MKLLMFDFKCTHCAAVFEELVNSDSIWAECPKCHGHAERQVSAPRIDRSAMAISESASPASIAHFDRLHQTQRAKEESCFDRNGDYGKRPGSD